MGYVARAHLAAGNAPSLADYNQGMDNEAQLKAWVDDTLAAMTNKSGGNLTLGAVVILDGDNDDAFKTTTVIGDRRVVGVLWEDIATNATGKVVVARRKGTVLVQGNVTRGHWIGTSATAGRGADAGTTKPATGAVGIATTTYSGGGAGSVSAIVDPENTLGVSTGKAFLGGGYVAGTVTTTHKLDFVTETSSAVAGAALTSARTSGGGVGPLTTHGYFLGGNTNNTDAGGVATTDKVTASTETTAAASSANLSVARGRYPAGMSPSGGSWGYVWHGADTAGAVSARLDKVVFATDTLANLGNQGTGYAGKAGSASPTVGFSTRDGAGGIARVNVTTDTASVSSSVLNAARSDHTAVNETTKVIHAGGSTPLNTSEKMTFSSETVAGLGAVLSSSRGHAGGVMSPTAGYACGGSTTAGVAPTTNMVTTVDKVDFSAETISAVGGAALPTATRSQAPVSIQQ
jgi:hypothetical protein